MEKHLKELDSGNNVSPDDVPSEGERLPVKFIGRSPDGTQILSIAGVTPGSKAYLTRKGQNKVEVYTTSTGGEPCSLVRLDLPGSENNMKEMSLEGVRIYFSRDTELRTKNA